MINNDYLRVSREPPAAFLFEEIYYSIFELQKERIEIDHLYLN